MSYSLLKWCPLKLNEKKLNIRMREFCSVRFARELILDIQL